MDQRQPTARTRNVAERRRRLLGNPDVASTHANRGISRGFDETEYAGSGLIHFQLIPDYNLENSNVDDLLRTIAGFYSPANSLPIGPHSKQRATWEIILGQRQANFYLTVPHEWAKVAHKQATVVWPRATIVPQKDPLVELGEPTSVSRVELKEHFLFPIKVDRRTFGLLPSLLETVRVLDEKEKVLVQIILDPAPEDWWQAGALAYEQFMSGQMPKRLRFQPENLTRGSIRLLSSFVMEVTNIVYELVNAQPQRTQHFGVDRAKTLRERPIGAHVAEKLRGEAFDITIRVATFNADKSTSAMLQRSVGYAFCSLDGENKFLQIMENQNSWRLIKERNPGIKVNRDYLSIKEATMLVQLPTVTLQKEYGIRAIEHKEVDLPKPVVKGGIHIGYATFRGEKFRVHIPTDHLDSLCTSRIVIGAQGTGKTTLAINFAYDAVHQGFSVVAIDPGEGEIARELLSALPPSKVIHLKFGEMPIAIDWREVKHSKSDRNRFASEVISFLTSVNEDEAGVQTSRYIRAAAKAVPNAKLSEIARMFTDPQYRKSLEHLFGPQEKLTWEMYDHSTPARQEQIMAPIFNRLDAILGDDYLANCLEADNGIDFVELFDKNPGKAIVVDIPRGDVGPEGVDILASLIITKLDLTMTIRKSRNPVFILQDEPHQYMHSTRIWRTAATISRKYRFSYCWLFQALELLPKDLLTIIRSAGCSFHLYASSAETFKKLEKEIAPITIEEALSLPEYHAINVIRYRGRYLTPFIAQMLPPPTKRRVKLATHDESQDGAPS